MTCFDQTKIADVKKNILSFILIHFKEECLECLKVATILFAGVPPSWIDGFLANALYQMIEQGIYILKVWLLQNQMKLAAKEKVAPK